MERYGVPFVVYGKNIDIANFIEKAGAQIDIFPTIYELVAPKGFEYYAFDRPLLSFVKEDKDSRNSFALGYESVYNGKFIAVTNSTIQYMNGAQEEAGDKELAAKALYRNQMGKALRWYIINKGYTIPVEKAE